MSQKSSKKVTAEMHAKKAKPHKHKKPRSKGTRILMKVLSVIGKAFATMFLVGIITGCIVVTALTVYVMKFSDSDDIVDIENYKYNYSTIIYAYDREDVQQSNPIEVQKLYKIENRKWVDYEDIPQHVKDAFRCTEDIRFFEHEGVDWKRTFASFANLFLHFYDTAQGGSTITQQVVKNITGDDAVRIQRKVREIFRAINMEKKYTKAQIFECYLNVINLGNNCYGVQTASEYYFGKDVKDLTIAEAAALAATTKSPGNRNPKADPESNKERRNYYTLVQMKKVQAITDEEYETALKEELKIVGQKSENKDSNIKKYNSYFVDNLYYQVRNDLMEEYGWDEDFTHNKIYNGGLRIYSTLDIGMQETLEKKYKDPLTFYSNAKVKDPPESAMVIFDLAGHMKAVVGGRGEKSGHLVLNRATQSRIGIGSSIKPMSAYSLAIDKNVTTYSTMVVDEPVIKNPDGTLGPKNYGSRRYGTITIAEAVRRSLNTIPVKLIKEMTPKACFDFMENKLGFTTLVKSQKVTFDDGSSSIYSDIDMARLAMGSLVNGAKISELANAYQIFGNGGYYNEMTAYTKVTDSDGNVLLEEKNMPMRAISEESASVMNKLLQGVVEGANGTGRAAKLSTHTVVGKTGTANDDKSLAFVGLTPYYVGAVWVGYDQPKVIPSNVSYSPAQIWKNVMADIHKTLPKKDITLSPNMNELKYCTKTGLLASATCGSTSVGYYKSDNVPAVCTGGH